MKTSVKCGFQPLVVFVVFLMMGSEARSADSVLESTLLRAKNEKPSVRVLGEIFSVLTNAPTAAIRDEALKACGAGLLYLGKADYYERKILPSMKDSEKFETSMIKTCGICNGTKHVMKECLACKGLGKCSAFRCDNGIMHSPSFNGKVEDHPCSKCLGTGICDQCKSTRQMEVSCNACRGKGMAFSPDAALAVYRAQIGRSLKLFLDISAAKTKDPNWGATEEVK